jgi:MoaA/NifB/PqqE/SkfB family radical SAM enzyme
MIVIDIIEYCNFKCYFCKAKDITEPKYMPLDLFKRIILEAKEMGITEIDLIPSKGEPFLHPDIYEMLAFLNEHMKYTIVFTNATAVNVKKLKQVPLNNIKLNVSYYGATPEKFKELTAMDKNLFDIVHKRLEEMTNGGIHYNLERRDYGYVFNHTGSPPTEKLDPKVKCHFHSMPKIMANGDVVFCKFVKDNTPPNEKIAFANLHNTSLKDALEDPIRYKFFDSQSICVNHCSSFSRTCYKESISSFKIMAASKRNYTANQELVDQQYEEIERETIQRAKS